METKWIKIKVSDILQNPWSTDTIKFEKRKIKQLPNTTKNWISWTLQILWMDEKSLLATLEDVKTSLLQKCEVSWKEFVQDIDVKKYEMKFLMPWLDLPYEEFTDEIGYINEKDMTIDIQEMLYQSIILNIPTIIKSPEAEQLKPTLDDNSEDSEPQNKVRWIYK